jgi:hypothetical protein
MPSTRSGVGMLPRHMLTRLVHYSHFETGDISLTTLSGPSL